MPLSPHRNPHFTFSARNSLGVFLYTKPYFLVSFAMKVSRVFRIAKGKVLWPRVSLLSTTIPRTSLKTGYTAPNTELRRSSVCVSRAGSIPSRKNTFSMFPQYWVSVEGGSTPACPCRSPAHLNPQQQPPTGRRKPPPKTSSMCP